MKDTKYNKIKNLFFAILIGVVVVEPMILAYGLTKITDFYDEKIIQVEKHLFDIESMLAKKEAVVLYDYKSTDLNETDIYWGAKYIKKTEVENYSFIYVKHDLFNFSGGKYWSTSVSGNALLKTETICLNLESNDTYCDSSVINGKYFANLTISNCSGDNVDCYSFNVATIGVNNNTSQNAFISSIIGIY